jgi:transposase
VVYVGIDLHRRTSHVAALDEEGLELLSRRVTNDPEALRALFAELGGEARVALEAAFGWEWLADLLEREGIELHLAHPRHTKAIAAARVKTDAVDARTLAHLLRADPLPEAYVAPPELRELRELLRHHIGLTRLRTTLKNRVHALLARQGVQRGRAELFGPSGRRFLGELSLPESTRRRLESLLALIADFDRELAAVKREIHARAKDEPRVSVLTRIPGVGVFIALLVLAEVGDVTRFPSARHLASWAGLTPRVSNSGERVRLGSITHQGSAHLRWGLVQAAQTAVRADGPLKATYERIKHRRGSKVAKVAVAREILTLCYYGLRDGEIRRLEAAAARANSALAVASTGRPTG